MEDLQELGGMKTPEVREEDNEEKGQEGHGERMASISNCNVNIVYMWC